MRSTIVELPPEATSLEEDSYVDAATAEELAERTSLSGEKLQKIFLPGRKVGPYTILGYIASGGMGDVYAAERVMPDGKRLGPVALKVIAPELRGEWQIEERFKREAAISRAIRSDHVTRVYEFGESDDEHMFMSMELMRGEELFDRLINLGSIPEKEVGRIMLSVLEGLRAVHDSGFIHRDLKPENIYFALGNGGFDETIKLLDFGIAKRADEPSDPFLSVVGKVYGTPEYIAPEQGLNPDVDVRADLYSIGVMMHESLTGALPFQGDTAYATILKHQTEDPPALPADVHPELKKIIFRALQKKPKDRYQSAREMLADLRDWYVQTYDDELSKSLRESANFEQPRARAMTPGQTTDTPAAGVTPPSRGAVRQAKNRKKSAASSPSPSTPPPRRPSPAAKSGPVPTTRAESARSLSPAPRVHEGPPAAAAAPPATQSQEIVVVDDELEPPSRSYAGIITMVLVLLAALAALAVLL